MIKQEKIKKIKELVERLKLAHDEPLSEEEIRKNEKILKVKYPEQYKEFLRMYGWLLLGEGFLGGNIQETHDLRENLPDDKFPKHIIPIDDNGSGDYWCLVCGGKDHGKVIAWFHDFPEEYLYPNVPDEEWLQNHPEWIKENINDKKEDLKDFFYPNVPKGNIQDKKEDFWTIAPDFWTWLLNRLELERQLEEDEI